MARPAKITEDRRVIMVRVRLTPAEKKQLAGAAEIEGVTLSDFLRVRTLHSLPRRRKPTEERAAFIRGLAELGKIGSNLNQIAHAFNRVKSVTGISGINAPTVGKALNTIDELATRLLNLLESGH